MSNSMGDRKSTRLNSSHLGISYAVFCLKKEEHTSELQSLRHLVCRLLLEKKKSQRRTYGRERCEYHYSKVANALVKQKSSCIVHQNWISICRYSRLM